jgi:hypothetical protein
VVLSPDRLSANELPKPALEFIGTGSGDLALSPNGNLIEIRYETGRIWCPYDLADGTRLHIWNVPYPVVPVRSILHSGLLKKLTFMPIYKMY